MKAKEYFMIVIKCRNCGYKVTGIAAKPGQSHNCPKCGAFTTTKKLSAEMGKKKGKFRQICKQAEIIRKTEGMNHKQAMRKAWLLATPTYDAHYATSLYDKFTIEIWGKNHRIGSLTMLPQGYWLATNRANGSKSFKCRKEALIFAKGFDKSKYGMQLPLI